MIEILDSEIRDSINGSVYPRGAFPVYDLMRDLLIECVVPFGSPTALNNGSYLMNRTNSYILPVRSSTSLTLSMVWSVLCHWTDVYNRTRTTIPPIPPPISKYGSVDAYAYISMGGEIRVYRSVLALFGDPIAFAGNLVDEGASADLIDVAISLSELSIDGNPQMSIVGLLKACLAGEGMTYVPHTILSEINSIRVMDIADYEGPPLGRAFVSRAVYDISRALQDDPNSYSISTEPTEVQSESAGVIFVGQDLSYGFDLFSSLYRPSSIIGRWRSSDDDLVELPVFPKFPTDDPDVTYGFPNEEGFGICMLSTYESTDRNTIEDNPNLFIFDGTEHISDRCSKEISLSGSFDLVANNVDRWNKLSSSTFGSSVSTDAVTIGGSMGRTYLSDGTFEGLLTRDETLTEVSMFEPAYMS